MQDKQEPALQVVDTPAEPAPVDPEPTIDTTASTAPNEAPEPDAPAGPVDEQPTPEQHEASKAEPDDTSLAAVPEVQEDPVDTTDADVQPETTSAAAEAPGPDAEPATAEPTPAPADTPKKAPRARKNTPAPSTTREDPAVKHLVVIQNGKVTHAADNVHVVDLDAAADSDNAHDILDAITNLKAAVADGAVRDDVVDALFELLRVKV